MRRFCGTRTLDKLCLPISILLLEGDDGVTVFWSKGMIADLLQNTLCGVVVFEPVMGSAACDNRGS
jgi:hypothetical protein